MAACEKCWTQASFDARLKGGSVVEHYERLLVENETEHTSDEPQCRHLFGHRIGDTGAVCGDCGVVL